MKRALGLMLVALLAVAPLAAAQDTVESVQGEIIKAWDGLKSFSGKFSGTAAIKIRPDMPNPMKIMAGGDADYQKGDALKHRLNAWAGLTEQAKMAAIYSVCDGKEIHVDTLIPFGQRASNVFPIDPSMMFGVKQLFEELNKVVNFTVLPAGKVGETDCYALEATAKEDADEIPLGKLQLFFAKETGAPMQIKFFDKAGADIGALNMTEAKANCDIASDVFKYVPPAPPTPPAPAATPAPAPAAAPAAAK